MNPMLCRLYGRFVIVERGGAGESPTTLTILMPNMTFGGSGLREHKALMTIARHFVDHRQTTLEPTFRNMTDGSAVEAEDFVWDLSGWELDLGARGGVTLTTQHMKEIVDLGELEQIQGRTAKLKADLQPGHDGIVRTAIHVGGGQAKGSTAFHTPPCEFIALSDANIPNPPRRRNAKFQIDIIDIALPSVPAHRVTFKNTNGETRHVSLNASTTPSIGLSNLCNELPHTVDVDHEFGQYYHVLANVAPDRLVPKVVPSGGDEDCNRQAKIRA